MKLIGKGNCEFLETCFIKSYTLTYNRCTYSGNLSEIVFISMQIV